MYEPVTSAFSIKKVSIRRSSVMLCLRLVDNKHGVKNQHSLPGTAFSVYIPQCYLVSVAFCVSAM